MLINVKTRDEEGNVVFEGKLNNNEISFLLQFSINSLMMDGVQFNVTDEEEDDDAPIRFDFPKGEMND